MTEVRWVKKRIPVKAEQRRAPFEVKTLEGTMRGKAGDWLVTGPAGEQWPVDGAIFRATYAIYHDDDQCPGLTPADTPGGARHCAGCVAEQRR